MPVDTSPPVAGILLAAGASSRMGRNKLLLEIDGEPVVRRTARQAIAAGLSPVLAVLGFEAERVREALRGIPLSDVVNPAFSRGINGSVALGIGALPAAAPAAVVLLADMPLVTADMVAELVARYRQTGVPLVLSTYGGVRAPPTLYDRSLFAEFHEHEGEGCGKRIVERHRGRAEVLARPAHALADLDVPADVDRVRAWLAGAVS